MMRVSIRASSMPELFDCPARWWAKHQDGKRSWSSAEALLGTAVHAGTAVFDRERATGHPIQASEAALAVVDAISAGASDVAWVAGGLTQTSVRDEAMKTHFRYCADIVDRPAWTEIETKLEPVELPFGKVTILLTGTEDRGRMHNGVYVSSDVKTGKGFKAGSYVSQVGTYALLRTAASGLPSVGQLDHVTQAGIQSYQLPTVLGAMLGDGERPGLIETAAKMIETGILYGNPKSILCTNKFCPVFSTCQFRGGLEQ